MDDSFSTLDEQLRFFYERTNYCVFEPAFILRVNQYHPELDRWLKKQEVEDWGFTTAYNPGSVITDETENIRQQNQLAVHLQKHGYSFLPGEGRGQTGDWPPEPSFLVLNISEKALKEMGIEFNQKAVVWGTSGKRAKLVWC